MTMEIIEELGRRFIQRSWFERRFVGTGTELRFLEGPLRPVRAAAEGEREKYLELAMSHAIAVAGWTSIFLLPFGMVSALFLMSSRGLMLCLLIDAIVLWSVMRFIPEIRTKRRQVRSQVERWPVIAPPSAESYFQTLWSRESFAKIGPRERRILFWSGLLFTTGGVLLVAMRDFMGWLGLVMGVLSLLIPALASRRRSTSG